VGDQAEPAGVLSGQITRQIDQILLKDYRTQLSKTSGLSVRQGYLDQIQNLHGAPDAETSLSANLGKLQEAFAQLANTPEDAFSLRNVYTKAQQLAQQFNDFSNSLTQMRNDAQTPRAPAPAPRPAIRCDGRVVDDETGLGLPNARVGQMFGTADAPPIAALTDGEGRFAFTLPGRLSRIGAVKTGYARGEVETSPDGRPVEIRLKRAAAISGHVLDQFGEPVAGARVSLENPGL